MQVITEILDGKTFHQCASRIDEFYRLKFGDTCITRKNIRFISYINFCSDDQRCIGIELCKMKDELFNCRVCCEWKKLGNRAEAQPGCKYMEMVFVHMLHVVYRALWHIYCSFLFIRNFFIFYVFESLSSCLSFVVLRIRSLNYGFYNNF